MGERRRMIKTDREHQSEVSRLSDSIRSLESDNERLKKELDQKNRDIADIKKREASEISLEPPVQGADASATEESVGKK